MRPALRLSGQVDGSDGDAGPEAVKARTLVALQLEQLQQGPDRLAGGGRRAQLPARVSSSSNPARNIQ